MTDWLDGLRRGEHRAFDAVFDAYQPAVWAFLVRLCAGRTELAEELLQETFLRLAQHARRLRPDSNVRAWLFTVAHNLWRSHRRWAWLDRERLRERFATAGEPAVSAHEMPEITLDQLDDALATLPPTLREVAVLVIVEEWTPAEVAGRLGITSEAVRQRLTRARRVIAQHVRGER